ncbi:unnamed protein product [Malus baccata var. baccata]
MCLVCTCSPPYSTRPFGNSLASDFIGTLKLSEFGIPMMGDPLGSSCLSSQKQNHEGVVGAQSKQYRATVELSQGCDKKYILCV